MESQNLNFKNYNEQYYSEYDSSDDNYVAIAENLNTTPVVLQKITIKIGNKDFHLLLGSRSGCTIINMPIAREIIFNCMKAQWSEKKPLELKSSANDIVETLGTLKTSVSVNDRKIQKAKSR